MSDTPRIYVACLAAYNNGTLHGRWIDADQDAESLRSEVEQMLAESPERGAEEYAIHDYEGFGSLQIDEYDSLKTVAYYGIGIAEKGEAFAAFVTNDLPNDPNDVESLLESFDEAYLGEFGSIEEWAEQFMEDTGQLAEMPENLRLYFDFEAFARDCELGGDVWTFTDSDYRVHIFWNH